MRHGPTPYVARECTRTSPDCSPHIPETGPLCGRRHVMRIEMSTRTSLQVDPERIRRALENASG